MFIFPLKNTARNGLNQQMLLCYYSPPMYFGNICSSCGIESAQSSCNVERHVVNDDLASFLTLNNL